MQYTIEIAPRAKKQINELPINIKGKIANAIIELSSNPFIGKALKANLEGLYSYRAGNYRIIYSILKKHLIIQIIKVMHRKDVYR